MARYTRLESVVMDALAHDLRVEAPDLAGQFEDSRPSRRRNSGFGLFTEMIVDRARPAPAFGPTGDLGTVHVMIGHLSDPVAFKARLTNGVLLGLMGDSYGQDTRAIDFATVPFDQVFTVDDQGDSIPFEPTRQMPPSPLLDLQRHNDHEPTARPVEPPLKNVGALQRVQAVETPAPATQPVSLADLFKVEPGLERTDQTSLLIGLWVVIGVVAILATALFRLPLGFAVVAAILLGRAVRTPSVLSAVRKAIDNWRTSGVIRSD